MQCRSVYAVMTRTAASLRGSPRVGVAIRCRLAMNHRTMARTTAFEVMPFDAAGESVALRNADDVHPIPGLKPSHGDACADGLIAKTRPELAYETRSLDALLFEVTRKRPREPVTFDRLETESDGFVAVLLLGAALDDRTGTGRDHRNGY